MNIRFAWHALWIARINLQALLFAILIWRKSYRQFPLFFWFTGWRVIQSATLATMVFGHLVSGRIYYETFRVGAAVECVLSFAVVYELLKRIIRDYPVLSQLGGSLYRWAAMVLILIGFVLAWYVPASAPGRLMATFSVLQRTARLLECGLLFFLFLFARSFGLSWKNRAFGIAFGFGVSAVVNLATAAIRVRIEPTTWNRTLDILTLVDQLGDLAGVLIWLTYLWPEETTSPPPPSLPKNDLERWNRELRKLMT
jgi:hypothetical protein